MRGYKERPSLLKKALKSEAVLWISNPCSGVREVKLISDFVVDLNQLPLSTAAYRLPPLLLDPSR